MDENPQFFKRCVACDVAKPHTAFLPSKYQPDGLTPRCRQCVLIASARMREERENLRLASVRVV